MKTFLTTLVILSVFYSCKHQESQMLVETTPQVQKVVDSIIALSDRADSIYELFIDKTSEYRCDMILHVGTEPFYKDEQKLSMCYLLSNGNKVNIYSGIESYVNVPNKPINYGRNTGITDNDNNKTWIIHLYKDSIIDVYKGGYVNPFLLIPSSPKYFQMIQSDCQ